MDSMPIRTFKFLELGKSYTHKKRPNGKVYIYLASYTLTNEEKRAICKCLRGI
jgi:hypothetical protein